MPRLRGFALATALWLAAALAGGQDGGARVAVTLLSTTDLHGNIYPIDYATNLADERGLAKAATLIRRVRAEQKNVVVVNTGDSLPGTALSFYHAARAAGETAPVIRAMNALDFDAMVLGNHEFDFGWPLMLRAARDSRFPWLAANAAVSGRAFFRPYVMKEVGGVRVAVLGLTTTAVPNSEDPAALRRRIQLTDPLEAARRWVPVLREKERADVVVAAMHMGLEEDPLTGARAPGQTEGENEALAIARQVPGIDVILMGHSHRQVAPVVVNGVLITQPAAWGRSVARVDLGLRREGERWVVEEKRAAVLPVAGVEPDAEILRLAAPMHEAAQRWLEERVGESAREEQAGAERFGPTALMEFVHRVQLEEGRAEVSLAESLSGTARVGKGAVTVRQLFGLYGVEKKLVTLEISGGQLRAILEQAARYFRGVEAGKGRESWVEPDFPAYNYYMAQGVTYEVDVSKPAGSRVQNLRYRGEALAEGRRLRVVTNQYLANGTAEYSMLRGARVLRRSRVDLRELMVRWMRRHGALPEAAAAPNWRLLPAEF